MANYMRSADELTPDTICELRCMRVAECLVDGLPYCLDCADDVIRDELPLSAEYRIEEAKLRALPAPRYIPRPGDDEKLREMGKAWESCRSIKVKCFSRYATASKRQSSYTNRERG